MANIALIDTGYLTATSVTGNQAPVIVNSGSAVELKAVSLVHESSANIDSSPIINSNSQAVVSFGSVSNGVLVLEGVLSKSVSADMTKLKQLRDMESTYGVKLLYYSDTADGVRDLTDTLGTDNSDDIHKANNFGGTATPHLHVRVTNFRARDSSDGNYIRYTLTMVETA